MTYAFTVKAATKDDAKSQIAAWFEKVVQAQPAHKREQAQALAAAGAFIDLVEPDFGGRNLQVHLNGRVVGPWAGKDVASVQGIAFTVSAGLVD